MTSLIKKNFGDRTTLPIQIERFVSYIKTLSGGLQSEKKQPHSLLIHLQYIFVKKRERKKIALVKYNMRKLNYAERKDI
jgi:hypothetical protein